MVDSKGYDRGPGAIPPCKIHLMLTLPLPLSVTAATQLVIWGALLIGVLLGSATQWSRFCTMGALADWFTFGGKGRGLMWLLAVGTAALLNAVLIQAGLLDARQTLAWSSRFLWLSYLVGGLLFGFGMVLTSGCPQRNLVRAASGNLKSLVTLLVAAVTAQMTLRGLLAEPRVRWLDAMGLELAHPQDLASLLGAWASLSVPLLRWLLVGSIAVIVVTLVVRHRSEAEPAQWLGAIAVGALVSAAWTLTGYLGFIPEHPETLEAVWLGTYTHRPESLTFAAPMAHAMDLLTLWSDKNIHASFGVVLLLGVLLGSGITALARGEFRWESFRNPGDMAQHLLGGVLLGFGGVTAMGCSIGQGVTGLSMLSAGACLAVGGMVIGTRLALAAQTWWLERQDG